MIVISKPTRSELRNAPSLVVHVVKHFTTARPTTLIFAPRIQLHSPLANDPPLRKTQTRLLPKKLGGRTKQVSLQSQSPRQLLPLALAGKRIPFLGLKGTIYHVTTFEVTSSTVVRADIKIANQRDLKTKEYKL